MNAPIRPLQGQMPSVPELLLAYRKAQIAELDATMLTAVASDWVLGGQSRRKQRLPTGDWLFWLILSGRGFGKSHTAVATARHWSHSLPMTAMIGATSDDTRNVLIEGESGVMATSPRWERPVFKKQDRLLEWPTGARTRLYSAEEPDRLRGANNYAVLADELASWKYAQETWDQAMFTLRLGKKPRAVITTTPRPIPLIRTIASDPRTFLTTGHTNENRENLADVFLGKLMETYTGTRLGQQELEGKILRDVPAAMWQADNIIYGGDPAKLARVVVAVDPTGSVNGDECGIVVVGRVAETKPSEFVVLEDATMSGSPAQWAVMTAHMFQKWKADKVVAEINFGGDMVREVLQQAAPDVPVEVVRASRGKVMRAEPVAALYEQRRVKHLAPMPKLEAQMLAMSEVFGYMLGKSPDRLDAMVWGVSALMGIRMPPSSAAAASAQTSSHWRNAGT